MVSHRSRLYTIIIILTSLTSLALHAFPAQGLPNYGPGVKPGDEVTYGRFNFTNNTPYQIFPANVTSLKIHVNTVNAQTKDVNASLIYNFKNATQQTQQLFGNTATGSGNIFPYLVAGNLTAGDLLYNPANQYYSRYVFNETVQKQYAGAVRTVNLFNLTISYPGTLQKIAFYWDALTGVLLEASEQSNYNGTSPQNFSIYFEATSTNLWSPSATPDFTFTASSITTEIVHAGETANFQLDLSSANSFGGQINLTAAPRIATNQLSTVVDPSTVTLTSTITNANASLQVTASKTTPVGIYIISVNATSKSISHNDLLLVAVAPPDFIINANPSSLTLSEGTAKNSTLTVTGRGGFIGTVGIQVQNFYGGGPQINLRITNPFVTVNATTPTATTILTVDATFSLPGSTQIYLTANSGNIYRNLNVLVNVTGPEFRLTSTPASLTFRQDQSAQATIQVTSILAFKGLVDLTTSSYGVTAALSATTVNLTAGGNANSTLTVSAPFGVAPGQYGVNVFGQDTQGLYRQLYIPVTITGPDFTIAVDRSFASLKAGQTANFTLTLSTVNRFNGTIALSSSVYGSLLTSISPTVITLDTTHTTATAKVTVTVPPVATPSQFSQVSIQASNGPIQHYTYITIDIVGPDFSITANPYSLSLRQRESGNSTITLSSIENFTGTVNLSTSTYGPISASITPSSLPLTAGGTTNANVTVNVSTTALPGYYSVNVQATSGSLVRNVYISVIVVGPDFTISGFPTFQTIQQGQSANSTVTIQSLENFTGTIKLTAFSYYPLVISPNSTTISLAKGSTATVQFQFSTAQNAAPGFYSAQIQATSGNLTHTLYLQVQIRGPDFSLFSSPQSLTIKQGATATSTLFLNSIDGFAGNITLSTNTYGISVTPSSTTVRLAAGSSANTTINIHVPTTTSIGNYYISINAFSGNIQRYTAINVNVIGPDFSLLAFPSQLTIEAGKSATSTIQLQSLEGFTGNVTLTANSYGANATGGSIFLNLNPTKVALSPGGTASSILNITTTKAAAGTNLQIFITASGTNQTHYATVYVSIIGPTFSLSANLNGLTLTRGGSTTTTITATSIDSFSGKVTLTASSPFGLATSLSSQNLTLTAGGSSNSILTVSSGPATQPGYYYVLVTGTSGNQTRSLFISVQVVAPDFIVQSNPSQLTIQVGKSAQSTIQLTSLNGYHGNVTLNAYFFGSGNSTTSPIRVTIKPSSVNLTAGGSVSATANITATASAVGFNYISIQATDGNLTRYTSIYVNVIGPSFGLTVNPPFLLTIPQGATATTTITTSSIDNFTGTVHLAVNSPFPFTATISPENVTLTPGRLANSTLTFSVHSASAGFYDLEVTGTSGNQTRSLFISVQVVAPVAPDFTLLPNPSQLTLQPGKSESSTIQLTSMNGYHGNLTLTIISFAANTTASPIGVTISPSMINLTAGGSASATANMTTTASSVGFNLVRIEATDGNLTRYTYIVVVVIGPSFGLEANPRSLSLPQGGTASTKITISSIGNFTGTVHLSVGSLSGFTGIISPENVTLTAGGLASSILNFTARPASAGFYQLIVTGTSGNITRSIFIEVDVTSIGTFTITANPSFLFIPRGGTAKSTVTLQGQGGFTGVVFLRASSIIVSGPTASVSPGLIILNSTITVANATVTITLPSNTTGIFDTVQVIANVNGMTQIANIAVQEATPDFAVGVDRTSLVVRASGSSMDNVSVLNLGGFNGTVQLFGLSSAQPGITLRFNPASVTLSPSSRIENSTVTITVARNVELGVWDTEVFGKFVTSSNVTIEHFATITITVLPAPDFTISANPGSFTVQASKQGTSTIALGSLNSFNGTVTLSTSGTGLGVSATVSPTSVQLLPFGNMTLTLTISTTAAARIGTYTVYITGNSTFGAHTTNITLTVTPPPDFKLSTLATSMIIGKGSQANTLLTLSPILGFNGIVNLTTSAPQGFTTGFSFNPLTLNTPFSTLTISVADTVATGNYKVVITGTGSFFTHTVSINVTVASSAKISLSVIQTLWTHRLSLSKNNNMQTFTATIKNTGQSPAYIQLLAAGNSTSSGLFFNAKTTVTVISPGQTITVTITQHFSPSSIGQKYNVAIQFFYGTSIDQNNNILTPTITTEAQGSFSIVK